MPGIGLDQGSMETLLEEDFHKKRDEMRRVAKDCIVVVDNIPQIGPDRLPRLKAVLTSRFEAVGRICVDADGNGRVTCAQGPDGSTLGFAFVEYVSPEEAHKALVAIHNNQLDRNHRFWACTAGDLEKMQEVSPEFVPPTQMDMGLKDRPNLRSWMLDERGRDQYMIRHEDETSIFWHDHIVKPQLVS